MFVQNTLYKNIIQNKSTKGFFEWEFYCRPADALCLILACFDTFCSASAMCRVSPGVVCCSIFSRPSLILLMVKRGVFSTNTILLTDADLCKLLQETIIIPRVSCKKCVYPKVSPTLHRKQPGYWFSVCFQVKGWYFPTYKPAQFWDTEQNHFFQAGLNCSKCPFHDFIPDNASSFNGAFGPCPWLYHENKCNNSFSRKCAFRLKPQALENALCISTILVTINVYGTDRADALFLVPVAQTRVLFCGHCCHLKW